MLFKKVLCPLDLSANSLPALEMAATLVDPNGGELVLLHVAAPPIVQETIFAGDEVESMIANDKTEFESLRPDRTLPVQHVFLRGNPGPEAVRFARDNDCDLIVLATHGRTGIARLLMGSVAEYISRHAHCPVLSLNDKKTSRSQEPAPDSAPFVTEFMQHASPVYAHTEMATVIEDLDSAGLTAVPVIVGEGDCTGILTATDIAKYRDLVRRYEEKDPSVIPEMFEVNEFGQRRTNNRTFDQVTRHMTSPVVTIASDQSCHDAKKMFEKHPDIHHLVVVDSSGHPLGIIRSQDIPEPCKSDAQHA